MRIVFYTISLGRGGAERCMSILANEFVKKGHMVSFIQNDVYAPPAYSLEPSIKVFSLGGLHFDSINGCFKPIRTLRAFFKEITPDIIISFFPDTVLWAKIASLGMRIPVVFSERNDPQNNIKGWKFSFFQKFAIITSDWLVFQTESARKIYGKNNKRSSVIINPCDTSLFPISKPTKRVIVSVGRLEPQKNQSMLINAFSVLSTRFLEYELIIYGEGSLRRQLQDEIDALGIQSRTSLPGAFDDVIERINGSAMFVLTSNYEGLPNALIEAMAIGLPCISTDCAPGGARELIRNGENGLIVPCNDVDSLLNAMSYILLHPDESKRMSEKARLVKEITRPDVIAKEWLNLICRIVNK